MTCENCFSEWRPERKYFGEGSGGLRSRLDLFPVPSESRTGNRARKSNTGRFWIFLNFQNLCQLVPRRNEMPMSSEWVVELLKQRLEHLMGQRQCWWSFPRMSLRTSCTSKVHDWAWYVPLGVKEHVYIWLNEESWYACFCFHFKSD